MMTSSYNRAIKKALLIKKPVLENSILAEILKKSQATYMNIIIADNEFRLKTDGQVMAVSIHYDGVFEAVANLPDGWFLLDGMGQMIIYRLSSVDLPELIFTFTGKFKPYKIRWVSGAEKRKRSGKIEFVGLSIYNEMEFAKWDTLATTYNGASGDFGSVSGTHRSVFVDKNMKDLKLYRASIKDKKTTSTVVSKEQTRKGY